MSLTPDEHAARAAQLLGEASRSGRGARRATFLATAALAHAELARYRKEQPPVADRRLPPITARPGPETLFDELKGRDGIAAVVRDLYRRVLVDAQLAHYFDRVPTLSCSGTWSRFSCRRPAGRRTTAGDR